MSFVSSRSFFFFPFSYLTHIPKSKFQWDIVLQKQHGRAPVYEVKYNVLLLCNRLLPGLHRRMTHVECCNYLQNFSFIVHIYGFWRTNEQCSSSIRFPMEIRCKDQGTLRSTILCQCSNSATRVQGFDRLTSIYNKTYRAEQVGMRVFLLFSILRHVGALPDSQTAART